MKWFKSTSRRFTCHNIILSKTSCIHVFIIHIYIVPWCADCHSRLHGQSAALESPFLLIWSRVNARLDPMRGGMPFRKCWNANCGARTVHRTYDWPQINLHVPRHFSHHVRNTDPSRKIETDDFETELPRCPVISIPMTGIDRTAAARHEFGGFVPGIMRHTWKRNGVDPIGTLVSTLHWSSMKITLTSATRVVKPRNTSFSLAAVLSRIRLSFT